VFDNLPIRPRQCREYGRYTDQRDNHPFHDYLLIQVLQKRESLLSQSTLPYPAVRVDTINT
jgi:hypothetical protein